MKKTVFFISLLSAILFVGCSSDDDDNLNIGTGYFKYNEGGKSYSLNSGSIISEQNKDMMYEHTVIVNSTGGSSIRNSFAFTIVTETQDLKPGNYEFDFHTVGAVNVVKSNQFYVADASKSPTDNDFLIVDDTFLNGAILKVEKSGDKYTFNVKDAITQVGTVGSPVGEEKTASFYYSGTLIIPIQYH